MKLLKILWRSIPYVLYGLFFLSVASWLYGVLRPPQIAEGVSSVGWLPPEATDISYYRSYGFTAYEFKISESGFQKWAPTVYRPPGPDYVTYQPVVDVADLEEDFFAIERYNSPLSRDEDRSDDFDYSAYWKASSIVIEDGLRGEMRRTSAGGCSIGYDRTTGTAYYQSNPR